MTISRRLSNIQNIALKDLKSYFSSPMAYLILSVFLFLIGWMFSSIFQNFLVNLQQYERYSGMGMGGPPQLNLNDHVLRPLYGNMNVILLLVVPFLTMRLIAEEKKNSTIELLFTAPVTWFQIVLGKFFSAFSFVFLMLSLTVLFPIALATTARIDWGVVAMCYLGTLSMVAVYVSVGLWCSSITENQIVAGVLSFGIILFLWVVKWAAMSAQGFMADFLSYLSIVEHFEDFARGVFNTKDLVFYLSMVCFWLFLTYKSLESYSWRSA